MDFFSWPHGMDSLLGFIEHLNTVHPTIKFTSDISHTEIYLLDLTIYIRGCKLYTRLHTKTTDRQMYLNYPSEHPMSLKRSIPYSQFLRLKRIHWAPLFIGGTITYVLIFHLEGILPWCCTKSLDENQSQGNNCWPQLKKNEDKNIPHTFITTYSRANPNFTELFSKHWPYLGRWSATWELGKQDFMLTYRKPPSLKDMLIRAKIAQPRTTSSKGCNRPSTCKYCKKISKLGRIRNLNNNKSYNTITKGTCQSNNLICCLECKWCHIKYVGQTRNRIIDRFQGHIIWHETQ